MNLETGVRPGCGVTLRAAGLVAVVLVGPAVPGSAEDAATFTYEPRIVAPGESFTVTGEGFAPGVTMAGVSLITPSGALTTLGVVPLVGGVLTGSFLVPTSQPPGPHFLFVYDAARQIAINLVGSLTVAPTQRPWFTYAPTTVAPGNVISLSASGFADRTVAAVYGVVDGTGRATTLGLAPLADGGFRRTVVVPLGLAPGSYSPFVRDLVQPVFAWNLDGPLAVTRTPPPPVVPVGFYPVGAAVNPVTNRVFVPNAGDDTLSVIDGESATVIDTVPVGRLPCAVGVDPRRDRVYVANANSHDVSVVDGTSHVVVATVAVGLHPCAVGVTPALNRVFVGNYAADSVSVIDGATRSVIATVPVGRGPFGIGTSTGTSRVYVANGYDNTVSVIDGAAMSVTATVGVGRTPDAVGVDPVHNRVYVANFFGNSLTVLDGRTGATLATVPVGREPDGVAVNVVTNRIFVSNYSSNTLSVIDGATHEVLATIPVGVTPDGLTANPLTGRVYVTNSNSADVSIVEDDFGPGR